MEELRVFIHTVLGEVEGLQNGVRLRKNEMILEIDLLQDKTKKLEEG